MFLEVYGRQKLMVQTECHLAECSRTRRLRPETSDGRLLTVLFKCWSVNGNRLSAKMFTYQLTVYSVDSIRFWDLLIFNTCVLFFFSFDAFLSSLIFACTVVWTFITNKYISNAKTYWQDAVVNRHHSVRTFCRSCQGHSENPFNFLVSTVKCSYYKTCKNRNKFCSS